MTTFGRHTTGWAALATPILLLAGTVAYIANGHGLRQGEAAGAIEVWAFIAFGVATVGLARLLEAVAPRGAGLLALAGIVGTAGGVAYGMDSIQVAVLGRGITDSLASPFALRIPGLAVPVALIGIGMLLGRHELVRRPSAIALVIAGVLFPMSRIPNIEPLAVASDLMLLAGMGSIGLTLLRPSGAPRTTAATVAIPASS